MNILLKSESTGLVGSYPESHKDLSDDLIPVDGNGDICLPCMGIEVEVTPELEIAPEPEPELGIAPEPELEVTPEPENIPEPESVLELEVVPEPKNKTTNRKDVK